MKKQFNVKNNKQILKISIKDMNRHPVINNIIKSQFPKILIDKKLIEDTKINNFDNNNWKYETTQKIINKNKYTSNEELLEEIKILWKELGIKEKYRFEFESFLTIMNYPERITKLLYLEKNNLLILKNYLIKFMKEKETRATYIQSLEELNNRYYNFLNQETNIDNSLIREINSCIKNIRISSLNVINNYIKVKEKLSVLFTDDKIDLNVLNKNFLFDNNYLLNMNSELIFFKKSIVNKILDINNQENFDTFLTRYNNTNNTNNNIINTLNFDLINAIEKCRYFIFQEEILHNLKSLNQFKQKFRKKKIYKLSKNNFKKKINKYNYKTLNNIDTRLFQLKTNKGRNYEKIFLNSFKKLNSTKITNKHITRILGSEPKTKSISIEREDIKYDKTYRELLEKKFLKSAEDNIKTKEDNYDVEKTDEHNNLTTEKNEVNILSNQLKEENINEINKIDVKKVIINNEYDENNSKSKNENENIVENKNIINIEDNKKNFDNIDLTEIIEIN